MPNTSSLSKADRTYREGSTGDYACILKDEESAVIGAARLTTIRLTLRSLSDNSIINSRDEQNVKNANNVTIDAEGNLLWEIQSVDNAITDAALANGNQEIHRALFEYTWDAGAKADSHEILLFITALDDVS